MIYACRDTQGRISGLFREPQPGCEGLPESHPDVMGFLGLANGNREFADMDKGLIRVLEDLIDVLIRRNLICITDLPMEAQLKLFDRKHFREGAREHALNLYSGSPQGRAEALSAAPDWSDYQS